MRRILVLVLAACAAVTLGLLGPPIASAAPVPASAGEVAAAQSGRLPSSPQCGPTEGFGKILYQSCARFNCDATTCLVRAYMGIVNKAAGPRTVQWQLAFRQEGRLDRVVGSDIVTIPAGEQRTAYSTGNVRVPCGTTISIDSNVYYSNSGWSPQNPTDNIDLWC
jgi:hypothetical protein